MGYYLRSQLPITLRARRPVRDLRSLFRLGDGSHLAEPLLPARRVVERGQRATRPSPLFDNVWSWLDDVDAIQRKLLSRSALVHRPPIRSSSDSRESAVLRSRAKGKLPNYCLIDPQFFGSGANDDHPDHDARLGQALIASSTAALAQSPQWSKCLFVLTYDEHGGFYDHVPPPTT